MWELQWTNIRHYIAIRFWELRKTANERKPVFWAGCLTRDATHIRGSSLLATVG